MSDSNNNGKDPPILLVKGPPGTGKTTVTAKILGDHLKTAESSTRNPRYNWFAPNWKRIDEAKSNLDAYPLRPKVPLGPDGKLMGTSLCRRPREIAALRTKGLAMLEYGRLCARCAYRNGGCPYWNQFWEHRDEHWILPHAHLFLDTIHRQDPRPSLLVIDEDIIGTAIGYRSYLNEDDLARTATWLRKNALPSWQRPLLDLMDALRDAMTQRGTVRNFQIASEIGPEVLTNAILTWRQAGPQLELQERESLKNVALDTARPPVLERLMGTMLDLAARPSRACIRKYDDPKRGAVLVLYNLARPQTGKTPTIILDSTGSPSIYGRLFRGRNITALDVDVVCSARVVQVIDGTYGKTVTESDEAVAARLLDAVRGIVKYRGTKEHPVAVITHKAFEQRIRGKGLRHIRTGHFYAERGTNRFLDAGCRDIVVVGTPTPNIDDLEMAAEALFAGDADDLDFSGGYCPRQYGMSDDDGMDWQIDIRDYADPRMQDLVALFREGEVLQAAHRIRPLDEGAGKTIWLLTSLPIPGLPPTDLIRLEDVVAVARGNDTVMADKPLRDKVREAFKELTKQFRRKPTLREVADVAGCSLGTASKYLKTGRRK